MPDWDQQASETISGVHGMGTAPVDPPLKSMLAKWKAQDSNRKGKQIVDPNYGPTSSSQRQSQSQEEYPQAPSTPKNGKVLVSEEDIASLDPFLLSITPSERLPKTTSAYNFDTKSSIPESSQRVTPVEEDLNPYRNSVQTLGGGLHDKNNSSQTQSSRRYPSLSYEQPPVDPSRNNNTPKQASHPVFFSSPEEQSAYYISHPEAFLTAPTAYMRSNPVFTQHCKDYDEAVSKRNYEEMDGDGNNEGALPSRLHSRRSGKPSSSRRKSHREDDEDDEEVDYRPEQRQPRVGGTPRASLNSKSPFSHQSTQSRQEEKPKTMASTRGYQSPYSRLPSDSSSINPSDQGFRSQSHLDPFAPVASSVTLAPQHDLESLIAGSPHFPNTLVPLHFGYDGQPTNENWLKDNEFRAIPSYNHTLPPYMNSYTPTAQRKHTDWTNHNRTQRGNPPVDGNGQPIDEKKWAEISNASNQCFVRYYSKILEPPLNKVEIKYLCERHRSSGLVRWIGVKLCMGRSGTSIYNGLLPVDYVDWPHSH